MSPASSRFGSFNGMSDGVFDYTATLNRLGGDVELFTDLARFFLEDADGLLARFHAAFERGNAREVELAAHALKGLCANFDARGAVGAAADIEETAQEGRVGPDDVDAAALDAAVADLKSALTRYLTAHDGRNGARNGQ